MIQTHASIETLNALTIVNIYFSTISLATGAPAFLINYIQQTT